MTYHNNAKIKTKQLYKIWHIKFKYYVKYRKSNHWYDVTYQKTYLSSKEWHGVNTYGTEDKTVHTVAFRDTCYWQNMESAAIRNDQLLLYATLYTKIRHYDILEL